MLLALTLTLSTPALASDVVQWDGDGCWVSHVSWDDNDREAKHVSAWVDYTLPDWSYDKDTGIVWTTDGWQTAHWADGWYESTLWDGRERWGVDIQPAQIFLMHPQVPGGDVIFEYAVYYRIGSASWWDNNGGANYQIELSPSCS